MKSCCDIKELDSVENNKIIGLPSEMINSRIEFHGEGNIIFFDENVVLDASTIRFFGNNSIVFLSSSSKHKTKVKIDVYNNSAFYMGKNCNTTRPIHAVLSEGKHIIIGNDCLFSFKIWFRNADPHLIYDGSTKKRINKSKSVFLGDHVWIGQEAFISKGTKIGSGTIVGAKCVTGGKTFASNCSYAGLPCKLIKENIFWLKPSVHSYTQEQTEASMTYNKNTYLYESDSNQLCFDNVDKELSKLENSEEKLEYLKKTLFENADKNRFYVELNQTKNKLISKIFSK